jgi:hypothetical protein
MNQSSVPDRLVQSVCQNPYPSADLGHLQPFIKAALAPADTPSDLYASPLICENSGLKFGIYTVNREGGRNK